jgi:hypothetical protein
VKRGKMLHTKAEVERAKNEGKKMCEKEAVYDRKAITFVICRVES